VEMKPSSLPENESTITPRKLAYQKPRLQTYGDLTEITQGKTGAKANDGAGHPNMHFTS
jgi:hypothetical protein